jgi:hypothetical protein
MVSTESISEFKREAKMASAEDQILTILIRAINMIRTITRWPQMTKWYCREWKTI